MNNSENSDKPLKIGIAGLGTVGGGVIKILSGNADLLTERCGRAVEVAAVTILVASDAMRHFAVAQT